MKRNNEKEGKQEKKNINICTNKFSKVIFIICIAIFMLTILIVMNKENIVALGKTITSDINRKNAELVNSEAKSVTNIDLTGLVTGEDTEHTHIYETVTNSTEQMCIRDRQYTA